MFLVVTEGAVFVVEEDEEALDGSKGGPGGGGGGGCRSGGIIATRFTELCTPPTVMGSGGLLAPEDTATMLQPLPPPHPPLLPFLSSSLAHSFLPVVNIFFLFALFLTCFSFPPSSPFIYSLPSLLSSLFPSLTSSFKSPISCFPSFSHSFSVFLPPSFLPLFRLSSLSPFSFTHSPPPSFHQSFINSIPLSPLLSPPPSLTHSVLPFLSPFLPPLFQNIIVIIILSLSFSFFLPSQFSLPVSLDWRSFFFPLSCICACFVAEIFIEI